MTTRLLRAAVLGLASAGLLAGLLAPPAVADGPAARGAILFEDDHEGPEGDGIWIMRPDGTGATHVVEGQVTSPVASPDGRWVAFRHNSSGTIRVRKIDGRGPGRVVGSDGQDPSEASWSPDSTQVVFSTSGFRGPGRPRNGELFKVDVASGETTRLTDTRRDERSPKWSPDGDVIMFGGASRRGCTWDFGLPNRFYDLETISADGGEPTRVRVPGRDRSSTPVDWHEDRVMVASGRSGTSGEITDPCPESFTSDNFVMRPDGRRRTPVAHLGSLSPNGKQIVYTVGGVVVEDLWISDLDGSDARVLRETAQDADWSATAVVPRR